jgi:hypothetical protein
MPAYQGLNSALGFSVNEKKSDMVITALETQTDAPLESFVFQYFPDEISDSKPTNYQQKEVPGGSLPIYQWVNGGERLINFTATFTSDVDYLAHGESKAGEIYSRIKSAGLERRNVDIRTALVHLRNFILPSYREQSGPGTPLTYAPQKLRLLMPGSGIGMYGGFTGGLPVTPDSVVCFMTQCDFQFVAFFPSGLPRIVDVQLGFAQSAQFGGAVAFPQSASGAVAAGDLRTGRSVFGFLGDGGSTLPYALTPNKR